jgi:hypothetical protein
MAVVMARALIFNRQLPYYHARNRLRSGLLGEWGEILSPRPARQKRKLTATPDRVSGFRQI